MVRASSAGHVGAVKAMEGAADPNAPKTEADLPAGVNEQLAQNVVAIVIEHCDAFGGLSFLRKFLGLPANDATPDLIMGSQNRISGFCGIKALEFTLGLARGLTESLRSLDGAHGVLCNRDGSVIIAKLYTIVHVAPLVWPAIARMIVNSKSLAYSVCFFLEAWNQNFRNVAASGLAATTAGMIDSWRAVADRAAANFLDFDWLDPRLWHLAALAMRLGKLEEMAVRLRVTCTLLKRLPVQLQQHMAVVPMGLIYDSPHLPTLVIATDAAAATLGFLQAALTHVAKQHADTIALESIRKLTEDGVGSIIVKALRNGGLELSLTFSLDVVLLDEPLALITPHRNKQLEDFGFAFTRVSPLPHQSLAMAQQLLPDSYAFATLDGCTGYKQGVRYEVFAKVQEQLGMRGELDAAAMEKRLGRMRAATGMTGCMTAREGGEVAAAAAALVIAGSHAPGFGTRATDEHGRPNGVAAARAMTCDHNKMATTQRNNRNSNRCTNQTCKFQLACAEVHEHTSSCGLPLDPRGTVSKHSVAHGKSWCIYCFTAT